MAEAVASMAAVRSAAAPALGFVAAVFVAAPGSTVASGVDRVDFAEDRAAAFVADASEARADVSDHRAVSPAPEAVGVTLVEVGATLRQPLTPR